MKRLFSLLVGLFACLSAEAATRIANSASYTDVNNALSLCVNGDILSIPAGKASWPSQLNVGTKLISIIGAGTNLTSGTVITNGFGDELLKFNPGTSSTVIRVSGIAFRGSYGQFYTIAVAGPSNMRIDHCSFYKGEDVISWNFSQNGTARCIGVVDHNDFLDCRTAYRVFDWRSTDGATPGSAAWAEAVVAGTTNVPVFEDNFFHMDSSFTQTGDCAQFYGQYGGRVTIRNNRFGTSTSDSFQQNWIDAHGDTPGYGVVLYEVYNNDFHEGTQGSLGAGGEANARGGMHLYFGNTNTTTTLPAFHFFDDTGGTHRVTNTFYWNNKLNGSSSPLSDQINNENPTIIQLNRNYFLRAPTTGDFFAGYTPLTYPHPLVTLQDGGATPTIQFSASTYSVAENGTEVTITASRGGLTNGAIGVSYATANGTATAGVNYTNKTGTLSWADGETANKTFKVGIINNALWESPDKTFTVALSSPTGGATLASPSSATVTITEDDTAPTTTQYGFRFFKDDGTQQAATAIAAQNTAISYPIETATQLAVGVDTAGDASVGSQNFLLEYKKSDDSNYRTLPLSPPDPSYRAAGALTVRNTSGTLAPALPAGTQQGDLLVLVIAGRPNGSTISNTVSGSWNWRGARFREVGTGANDLYVEVWSKIAGASESAPTVTPDADFLPGSTTGGASAHILSFFNVQDLMDATVTVNDNAAAATWTPPSITSATDKALIVSVVETADDNSLNFNTANSFTLATSGASYQTTTGSDHAVGVARLVKSPAGAVTMPVWNESANGNDAWVGLTLAFAPSAERLLLTLSPYIAASGQASTNVLSAPSGKTSSDFQAGRIQDDETPADSVTLSQGKYSVFTWNIRATSITTNGSVYTFRVTKNGTALDTYSQTPQWTLAAEIPPDPPPAATNVSVRLSAGVTVRSGVTTR